MNVSSMENSLQSISSNLFSQKRNNFRSDSNVIQTRQTCGQRSSMAAGSKRQALAFYVCVRICFISLMSRCRGESDPGLYMCSGLAKKTRRCAVPTSNFRTFLAARCVGNRHCGAAAFLLQVPTHAQTWIIRLSSAYRYYEHISNSFGKIKC